MLISVAAILNYALTLESLEAAFWTQGTKNYTQHDFEKVGVMDPKFHKRLVKIREEEKTHEHFLMTAIIGVLNSFIPWTSHAIVPLTACDSPGSQSRGAVRLLVPVA